MPRSPATSTRSAPRVVEGRARAPHLWEIIERLGEAAAEDTERAVGLLKQLGPTFPQPPADVSHTPRSAAVAS